MSTFWKNTVKKFKNFSATQILRESTYFDHFVGFFVFLKFANIDFTENLNGRKILEFSHCEEGPLVNGTQYFSHFLFR